MDWVIDAERRRDRAADLVSHNGIERILVTLDTAAVPPHARLEVIFYNSVALADIVDDIDSAAKSAADVFSVTGGSRITDVAVTGVAAIPGANSLRLTLSPIGDYSTYQLLLRDPDYAIDPLFRSADFKFRPGCFNTNCAPLSDFEAVAAEPAIDYLAKDFDSFKHLLINAMAERVPDWRPTSEADLDQVLIDLIAADADELSDFQDRVANEAYLGRARKRVTLARYGRLLDYHIHQGNQAATWLALEVGADLVVDRPLGAWSGTGWRDPAAVIFAGNHSPSTAQALFSQLNELRLYTWDNVVTGLDAGSTRADLILPSGTMTQAEADTLRDLLRRDDVPRLLVQQRLNPETGTASGVDTSQRQLLRLLEGDAAAQSVEDPVAGTWLVRVHWRGADALRRRFCFVTACPDQPVETGVAAFHGNLIEVTHGRPHRTVFRAPGEPLDLDDDAAFERLSYRHYHPLDNRQLLRGTGAGPEVLPTLAEIPQGPLAYRDTPPGGEYPTRAALQVEVSGFGDAWDEQPDLIGSKADDDHYRVETDENRCSRIVFGDNVNGRALPEAAQVVCRYRIGQGVAGNVGPDALTGFDGSASGFPAVTRVWNPLDVTNGRDPEPRETLLRRIPEAYRRRQLRAVTLEDYARRAEELPMVSHARARYLWTGSWRTVRISIDLKAGYRWREERDTIAAHLDAVRLIGEDLEVREARFVSLDIYLKVCAHGDFWPGDLRHSLAAEFSNTYTADGRPGFFHPDGWTFGQTLHASQIIGRALEVTGVERVLLLSMRRWHAVAGAATDTVSLSPAELGIREVAFIAVEPFEIITVASDPNHLERGRIQFDIQGGRR